MAHHLIALLFSSAQYTTSPSMKPMYPVHNHTTEILFPLFAHVVLRFIYSCPTVTFFTFFIPPPSLLGTVASIFILLCLCLYPHLSVCLGLSTAALKPPPTPLLSSVPLVSGGLAGRQQKWLWDWGMAALLSLTTVLLWWAFNCILIE